MCLWPNRFYWISSCLNIDFCSDLSSLCTHCLFLSGFQQLAVCLFVCLPSQCPMVPLTPNAHCCQCCHWCPMLPLATCHQRQVLERWHLLVNFKIRVYFSSYCISQTWWSGFLQTILLPINWENQANTFYNLDEYILQFGKIHIHPHREVDLHEEGAQSQRASAHAPPLLLNQLPCSMNEEEHHHHHRHRHHTWPRLQYCQYCNIGILPI